MFAPRGCTVLWISPKYKGKIHPPIPFRDGSCEIHGQFIDRDTQDDTRYLTAAQAIQYFNDLGGLVRQSIYTEACCK